MKPRRKKLFSKTVLVGVVLAAAASLVAYQLYPREPPHRLLAQARRALQLGEFARAGQLVEQISPGAHEYADGLLIAGEAATRQNHFEEAIACYEKIPAGASDAAVTATYCIGDLLFQLGEASQAESRYRRVLDMRPDDAWAREQLASLLINFGRHWEALPHLFELVRTQRVSIEQLLLLGDPDAAIELPVSLSKFRSRAPRDPLPLIALARTAFEKHDRTEAVRLSRQVIDAAPAQIEAWALLGRALADRSLDEAAFLAWHGEVPPSAEAHPDVWLARGEWARQHGEIDVAVRCFWEAARRFPDSRIANYQLSQMLIKLDPQHARMAAPFLDRAERLEELRNALNMVYRQRTERRHVQKAAELTESLGRLWEAAAWRQVEGSLRPGSGTARQEYRRLAARLSPGLPRVLPEFNPAEQADLSSFPLPAWRPGSSPAQGAESAARPAAMVQFENRAAAAGIEFRYFNGADPPQEGKLIYQSLGGGVAAIDYDRDLWPDLFFAQGAPAPNDFEEHDFRDRLYRNLGDGRFSDVTLMAGLGDRRYTLGVAAGDINNDGFPEIYLANAGTNRLYRNNGDGTFTDITTDCGLAGRRCTASCLIADLNGDSFPDLFDVNYLAEPEVYALTCVREGKRRSCDPRLFRAAEDQLFLSRGDGSFEDVTEGSGISIPDGKGLGVVAADFSGSGRLDLFVANDGTGNFYFVNQTGRPGEPPVFREMALSAGVAFSEEGKVQACMGIAVDDADGDGRLDLLVTNFYDEGSAFYHQIATNLFEDARRRFGLREPSLHQLGFGAQFIDADLDGFPDLIVTNGHIEDFTDLGRPYAMRPQYFRNVGGKWFEELAADRAGPFFVGEYLGRGLARLDWNRDGKEDVVISHLDAPAALVTNMTRGAGHFLALSLVSTETARDAIGTQVQCTIGDAVRTRQLTAGDGYMVSNERQLVIGLGTCDVVDRLTIRWLSGREQTFTQVAADHHWMAIENQQALVRLPVDVVAVPPSP
jgi:tetratricopeptide (TPR) repeat protein